MHDTDALLADFDLLGLVQEDVQLRRVARTSGGELAGPCPFCRQGVDRFRVWPKHPSGRGRWWCRRCGRGGDAIAYVQERDGVGFKEALRVLGLDRDEVASSPARGRRTPARPAVPEVSPPCPEWQERARAFAEYARNHLESDAGERARAYLAEVRGLQGETVDHWGIGYNPGDVYDRKVHRWGLSQGRAVYLSRGIVIPCEVDGGLWYVQVRRPQAGGQLLDYVGGEVAAWLPEKKYMAVRGGTGQALYGGDSLQGRDVVLLAEGELDALLAWQEARDLVDVATMGGSAKANQGLPGRWLLRLLHYKAILVAYDADGAGRSGAAALAAQSKRAVPVAVPRGRDLTGFWQAGGDLRGWIAECLAQLPAAG
jgi:DNA primase